MEYRWFSVLVILFIWFNIGNGVPIIGREICNCRPSIIRTAEIFVPTANGDHIVCTKIPGAPQYTPIKNACSCANTPRVTPAFVPRVELDLAAMTPTLQQQCDGNSGADDVQQPRPLGERGGAFYPAAASACTIGGRTPSGQPVIQELPGPDGIDEPATGSECCNGGPPAVAVDPVSLMLAQAAANRCRGGVREDRLAFGQIAVPKDAMPRSPAAPDVNEEGLYALDKAIVELKTCKRHGLQNAATAQASDTDTLLALEEDAQPDDDDANTGGPVVNLPSYVDVGYRTETPSCAPLVGGVPAPVAIPEPAQVIAVNQLSSAAASVVAHDAVQYSPRYCSSSGCTGPCSSGKCSACCSY